MAMRNATWIVIFDGEEFPTDNPDQAAVQHDFETWKPHARGREYGIRRANVGETFDDGQPSETAAFGKGEEAAVKIVTDPLPAEPPTSGA